MSAERRQRGNKMGYHSDVVIAADFETTDIRDAAWTAAKLRYQMQDNMWEKFQHFQEEAIVFEAQGIKWYPSYEDVETVNQMVNFWHNDFDANVKVVIVGEEVGDDTENIYECDSHRDQPDWFWDIYIQRSIDAPWKWGNNE